MEPREEFEPDEAEEIRKEVADDGMRPAMVAEKHLTSVSVVRRIVAILEGRRAVDKFMQPADGLHKVDGGEEE
jgi:hypothetical protein